MEKLKKLIKDLISLAAEEEIKNNYNKDFWEGRISGLNSILNIIEYKEKMKNDN